uniref:efflux RND transporter permease subunit n=1 Tax=Fulvivirga sp. TaxID=1931237 RepID=UPI0040491964
MSDNKNKKSGFNKTFGLTNLALNNRTTVYFLTFLIVVMGLSAYIELPKDSYPEIEQPIVYIGTPYPGNSPIDIENLVTRTIEKEINSIAEVDNIKSTSVQDYSTIIVEFRADVAIGDALTKVKDAVDKAKPDLPSDLPTDPNIFEVNFSEFPILNINLSGDYSLEELNKYAEILEDEIEKVKEVSKVEIRGIDEKEVKVDVDPYLMESRNISFSDIENAIRAENLTLSGGAMLEGGIRRTIRVLGEFDDPLKMSDIIIKHEKGNIVYLRDVAKISFGYKEKQSYARLNGKPVIMVDVVKRSGENLLSATEKINRIIDEVKATRFPQNIDVVITNDQSDMTREMVSNLENNIISGVILVVLVLLFFLGTRNALFVGIAIPLSMFMTFLTLQAFGITINMMVLFSLILALGMLVDNGIVVVENVYRLMEEGEKPLTAAKRGVGEVALPIISSTATTLAAFLPLAFWPGLMGQFMGYLPITLIIVLSSSLFVALVINPVFVRTFMKVGASEVDTKKVWRNVIILFVIGGISLLMKFVVFGNLAIALALLILLNVFIFTPLGTKFQAVFLPSIEQLYKRTLEFALRGRNAYLFFAGTFVTLILSIVLLGIFTPKVIFFPVNEPKYVNAFIEFPIGTDINTTNEFTLEAEKKVQKIIEPYMYMVESVISKVGQDTSDPNDPSAVGQADTPEKARITVNFKEFKERIDPATGELVMSSIV